MTVNNTPSLIEQVREILQGISGAGWKELFESHGLNIDADQIIHEFTREVKIDRTQPGFEDFSLEGYRAIEPFRPAQSLLFHALASPQVVSYRDSSGKEIELGKFPTFEQICVVENFVYGIFPASLEELRVRANNAPMAIAVFASEYRPAIMTVHQKHADKCFSRVGVSRVGTAEDKYDASARGFAPFVESDKNRIRVLPCYYSAYIAIQVEGNQQTFGPIRFQKSVDKQIGDADRRFWVPMHKLFAGAECIRNHQIAIKLKASHVNEKIRKAHLALAGLGYDTGWHEPDLSEYPFVIKDQIAALSLFANCSEGLLKPIVSSSLVEIAHYKGKILTYKTPINRKPFRSSVIINSRSNGARSAPEYVHARHKIDQSGANIDLNERKEVAKEVEAGGFQAIHYLDYTGDGCIEVEIPELAFYLPEVKPAYSMVSAVDFFPLVKQYELVSWWEQAVPGELTKTIWPANPGLPLSLADSRYPANLTLTTQKLDAGNGNVPKKIFDSQDNTISTVVGLYQSCDGKLSRIDPPKNFRVSTLPDGASGVYAPGWDSSIDRTDEADPEDDGGPLTPGVTFFNNYGLGSPFPEDAMLCAALSSFWPAAAPDITRSFAPGNYASATPLPDELIGMTGEPPWNGIPGPRIFDAQGKKAEFVNIEYGDFITPALKNTFDFSKISRITLEEYTVSTIVTARVYAALGALTTEQKRKWVVFSFKKVGTDDPERQEAERIAQVSLNIAYTYRFEIFKYIDVQPHPDPQEFKKKMVTYDKIEILFGDAQTVLKKTENGWDAYRY